MSEFNVALLAVTLYKALTLLVGLVSLFFGYRLFGSRTNKKAGELSSRWGDKSLVLKQAAPGTFFALFGAIVLSIGLLRGFEIKKTEYIPSNISLEPSEPASVFVDEGPPKSTPPIIQTPASAENVQSVPRITKKSDRKVSRHSSLNMKDVMQKFNIRSA